MKCKDAQRYNNFPQESLETISRFYIYIYKLTLQGAHKTANHKITVEQAFEGKWGNVFISYYTSMVRKKHYLDHVRSRI